jgi:excisionase family DNA binding protein
VLTVARVAERYGVTEGTVLAWISSGELKALNVGRKPGAKKPRWRVSETALEAFEAARSAAAPAPPKARRPRRQNNDVVRFY